MPMHKHLAFVFLAITVAFLGGCATGPSASTPAVSQQEAQQAWAEANQNNGDLPKFVRSDADNVAILQTISARIDQVLPPFCQHFQLRQCGFMVEYDPADTVNAHADGQQKVTMYKGLMDYLSSEDEIALVLGHEVGHVLASHVAKQQQNVMAGALVGTLLDAAAGTGGAFSRLGAQTGMLLYSKEQEREADLIGAYLLSHAGYNLDQGGRLFSVFAKLSKQQVSGFTDTHPTGPERV
ncbi:MAG: hypothetical protein EB121_06035, partial [Alphaproteobacteria bacterium]|nr:hypothetical protein [Alphaproteobacteria bacterium]